MKMRASLAVIAACSAVLMGAAPASFAAGNDQSGAVHTIKPDQMRASKLVGSSVYDRNNQKIGSVQDLVLDKSGRVESVVVDVGSYLGVGGRNVAVKMSDIKTDNNRLTLDRTKAQLQQTASFQLEDRDTGAGQTASPPTGGTLGNGGTRITQ